MVCERLNVMAGAEKAPARPFGRVSGCSHLHGTLHAGTMPDVFRTKDIRVASRRKCPARRSPPALLRCLCTPSSSSTSRTTMSSSASTTPAPRASSPARRPCMSDLLQPDALRVGYVSRLPARVEQGRVFNTIAALLMSTPATWDLRTSSEWTTSPPSPGTLPPASASTTAATARSSPPRGDEPSK